MVPFHSSVLRFKAALIGGLVILMPIACSSETTTSVQSPSEATESQMASPTDPLATTPPTSSADKDVPEAGTPQTESVSIVVDTSDGVTQEAAVALGSPVSIRVISDGQDEFHLHGYDLVLTGTDVEFNFTADRLGEFVLEGHESGEQILILTVFED